jgi:site-specific DNA-cytosine methylase
LHGKYHVAHWTETSHAVIAGSANGAFGVADPRSSMDRAKGDHYLTGGHYGVTRWADTSGAVSSSANLDNGRWSVADPRIAHPCPRGFDECYEVCAYPSTCADRATCANSQTAMPAPADKLIAVIHALDGTWHRPFTTLELAALQGLVDPEEQLILDGLSDSGWREHIGNCVPPPAAQAIASEMGRTILLAWSGETFALGSTPIWVRPVAVALSVQQGEQQ